jgi:hypothetical protein
VPPLPLAALLRLEQAAEDALVPLGTGETIACLLACSPVVNVDPWRREALLATLAGLVASLPPRSSWALRCTRTGGWPAVARLLAAGGKEEA